MNTSIPSAPGKPVEREPFLAFVHGDDSLAALKTFAASHSFSDKSIYTGDIATAVEFLKNHAAPKVLCVEVASAESAPGGLDKLADVCSPETKVIVCGAVNEFSFFRWLTDMGISDYLLKPLTGPAIEVAYKKTQDITAVMQPSVIAKKEARIISVIGARGGVGATTVAVNMAWILAQEFQSKTAILDLDPQLGTVALALDVEPGRGLRDALEKPERIDSLFMDRVMVRLDDYLSILSTEEPLEENLVSNDAAATALFKQTRPKFSHIVVDVPRVLTPFTRAALKQADHIVCVTELTITGLREALRYLEYFRNHLKVAPPVFVANKVGLAGRHQMPQVEFEKGLGAKIDFAIPFVIEAHAAATAGEVLVQTSKSLPATRALHSLAGHFTVNDGQLAPEAKTKGLLGLLKKGK